MSCVKIIKSVYHTFRKIFDSTKAAVFQKRNLSFVENIVCSELFITHSFGGGTLNYEKNYLNGKKNVFIIRNVKGLKTRFYKVINYEFNTFFFISANKLLELLVKLSPQEITISSLVSYTNCFDVLNTIIQYKLQKDTFVRYMIHDYHCVCQRFDLVENGQFCKLNCSVRKCSFNSKERMTYIDNITIETWRENWQVFLSKIDEIRVFCTASKQIIQSVYSSLLEKQFNLIPHDMSYCTFKPYTIRKTESTRIAVVGTCDTIAKGNQIVNDFINQYNKKEIVLIGNIPLRKENIKKKNVIRLGSYENKELPELLERYNVEVVIFPSIWPETFSYLVSELIKTEVIIIAFDIGAQGEKVKKYKNGRLCEDMEIIYLMKEIDRLC